jgi:hypothetical protein
LLSVEHVIAFKKLYCVVELVIVSRKLNYVLLSVEHVIAFKKLHYVVELVIISTLN